VADRGRGRRRRAHRAGRDHGRGDYGRGRRGEPDRHRRRGAGRALPGPRARLRWPDRRRRPGDGLQRDPRRDGLGRPGHRPRARHTDPAQPGARPGRAGGRHRAGRLPHPQPGRGPAARRPRAGCRPRRAAGRAPPPLPGRHHRADLRFRRRLRRRRNTPAARRSGPPAPGRRYHRRRRRVQRRLRGRRLRRVGPGAVRPLRRGGRRVRRHPERGAARPGPPRRPAGPPRRGRTAMMNREEDTAVAGTDHSDPASLAPYIQHTAISAGMTRDDLVAHCEEAVRYGFNAAMIPASWAGLAADVLRGTGVTVASALDFPTVGVMTSRGKAAEARAIAEAGAEQIDMGVQVGWLRSGMEKEFREDIAGVVAAGVPVKVMLELPLLTEDERERAVELAMDAGAAYLKNASSGSVEVANPESIAYLAARVRDGVRVKASGGIKTLEQARALLDAGASLLGTSSGVAIVTSGRDGGQARTDY